MARDRDVDLTQNQDQDAVPEHRCGFEMLATDVSFGLFPPDSLSEAVDDNRSSVCCRTTDGRERCLWHADEETKSADELPTGASQTPVVLDGARLAGTEFESGRSLSSYRLRFADLSEADLWFADLSEASLFDADLSEAFLGRADLSEAFLWFADLSEAVLEDADLSETDLEDADLSEASLKYADLSEAFLWFADLSEASLRYADLSEASLKYADLQAADLRKIHAQNANFQDATFGDRHHEPATLENAVFRNTDLRGADFTDARLDQIDLTDARIDAETTFDDTTIYDQREDVTSRVRNSETDAAPPGAWVQRRLERLYETNALSTVARKYHIRKQRAKRTHHWRERNLVRWGWLWVLDFFMGYGESPWKVARTALLVVVTWAVVYPLGDWVLPVPNTTEARQYDGEPITYPTVSQPLADVPETVTTLLPTFLDSLYFSTVTFTTLGFGDFRPTGWGRVLATFEAALGVTLFAVLVFVLGRRATR